MPDQSSRNGRSWSAPRRGPRTAPASATNRVVVRPLGSTGVSPIVNRRNALIGWAMWLFLQSARPAARRERSVSDRWRRWLRRGRSWPPRSPRWASLAPAEAPRRGRGRVDGARALDAEPAEPAPPLERRARRRHPARGVSATGGPRGPWCGPRSTSSFRTSRASRSRRCSASSGSSASSSSPRTRGRSGRSRPPSRRSSEASPRRTAIPTAAAYRLRHALAERHGVGFDEVTVCAGADAVIGYVAYATLDPGGRDRDRLAVVPELRARPAQAGRHTRSRPAPRPALRPRRHPRRDHGADEAGLHRDAEQPDRDDDDEGRARRLLRPRAGRTC